MQAVNEVQPLVQNQPTIDSTQKAILYGREIISSDLGVYGLDETSQKVNNCVIFNHEMDLMDVMDKSH